VAMALGIGRGSPFEVAHYAPAGGYALSALKWLAYAFGL
jgi:hypothetical protein